MMMKSKWGNIVLACLFVSLLVGPFLATSRKSADLSETENRYLAAFPQILNDEGQLEAGFKSGFESWFNDHVGFRSTFAQIGSGFSYRLLQKSPTSKVVLGKDGWMFYTGDRNIEIADGRYEIDIARLEEIKRTQEELQAWLAEQGIEYVLILPTSKVSIYPEMLGGGGAGRKTPVDIVADYLEANTTIRVVRLKEALFEAKQQNNVFFKTDTHWNENGLYAAYQKIISDFNRWGMINSKPIAVSKEQDLLKGEFSAMMGNIELIAPESFDKIIIPESHANPVTDPMQIDALEQLKDAVSIRNRSFQYANHTVEEKSLLVYGDSMFGSFESVAQLFAQHFSEFTFLWINQLEFQNQITQQAIDYLKPDIVALEITERYIDQLGNSLNYRNLYGTMQVPSAQIVASEIPAQIEKEKECTLRITIKNTGEDVWSENGQVRLGFLVDNSVDTGGRFFISSGVKVLPGESYTFEIPDFYFEGDGRLLSFQMLEEGVRWFGEKETIPLV